MFKCYLIILIRENVEISYNSEFSFFFSMDEKCFFEKLVDRKMCFNAVDACVDMYFPFIFLHLQWSEALKLEFLFLSVNTF